MRDLNDFMYFAAVVEKNGFSAASRATGLPKSTLSRRIAALEKRLGVKLLQRSTRRLSVTDLGQQFYLHCQSMLQVAQEAELLAASAHDEPCGSLKISCPLGLLHTQVTPVVIEFMRDFPLVRVEVLATNQAVDVVGEGVDFALRVRPLPLEDSNLSMRQLGWSAQKLVASPELVRQFDAPRHPESLRRWPMLAQGNNARAVVWRLMHDGRSVDVPVFPRLSSTDQFLLKDAALQGAGIVLLPELLVQEELARHQLMEILPQWTLPAQVIHAVFGSRTGRSAAARVLLDRLAAAFSRG